MKLLKLNNKNTLLSRWTNNFKNLSIKPNSKIALQSISMEVNNTITINGENDTFAVQVKKNTDKTNLTSKIVCAIPHGVYLSIFSLLEAMQVAINSRMRWVAAQNQAGINEVGVQWQVLLQNKSFCQVNFKKKGNERLTDVSAVNITGGEDIPGSGIPAKKGFVKNGGDAGLWNGTLISKIPISWSSCDITTQICRQAGQNSSWAFGLIQDTSITEIIPSDFAYAIYSRGDGQVYYKTPSRIAQPLGVETDGLQLIAMTITMGTIQFFYKVGGAVKTEDFIYNTNYHFCFSVKEVGVVGLCDDVSDKLTTLMWIPSAFQSLNNDGYVVMNDNSELIIKSNLDAQNDYRYLSFQDSKFGNAVGFPTEYYLSPDSGLGQDGYFLSPYSVQSRVLPTSLNVYIPNMKLDCYSAVTRERESILAILPDVNFQSQTYKYVYQIPNPVFIDIDNASDQPLENIEVMVVSGDESANNPLPLTAYGCTLSVLLDG